MVTAAFIEQHTQRPQIIGECERFQNFLDGMIISRMQNYSPHVESRVSVVEC